MAGLRTLPIALAALALVFTGCRSEPEEEPVLTIRQTTEDMIRSDVAGAAGLGDLVPVCPDVVEATVGTAYECTATTDDQRIVAVAAAIDDLGRVRVNTTNLITAAALPSFERAAVEALNTTVGSRLENDDIDCGDAPVLFGQDRVMVCALRDPHTESVFDVSLTITDIEARQFSLVVADEPRA